MDIYIYKRGGAEKPEARMAVNNSGWKGGGEEQTGTDEVGRCGEGVESVGVDGVDRRLRRAAEKPFTESTDRFPRGCVRGIRI